MADFRTRSAAGPPSAFGADLHLELRGPGLRAELTDALREAVRTGRLAPGSRLPASRSLGADLGLSRHTVVEAYAELVAEGRLTAAARRALTAAPHDAFGYGDARGRMELRTALADYVKVADRGWQLPERDALVVNYAAPSDSAWAGALDALCRVLP